MRRRLLSAAVILASTAIVIPMAGCSAKPENSPAIRTKFAEVEKLGSEQKEIAKLVRSIASDLTVMKDQMSDLRALTPDADGQILAVKKLEEIEARLARMESTTSSAMIAQASTTRGNADGAESTIRSLTAGTTTSSAPTAANGFNGLATPAKSAAETIVASAAPATKSTAIQPGDLTPKPAATTSAPKASTAEPATTPKSTSKAPAPTKSKPRGTYYTIKDGDSLEKIAAANGISVASLREANRLPNGARPLKGQNLFIPGKS